MRIKLFLLIALLSTLSLAAQRTGVQGVVVDAESGLPVSGASVILESQNILAITGPTGDFLISNAQKGDDNLAVVSYGYKDLSLKVSIVAGVIDNLGTVKLTADQFSAASGMGEESLVSESLLEDEEGNSQAVGALTGSSDNVYYQTASYDFNVMRFRFRGYDQNYSNTYINGVNFNEPIRGLFSYSMLGGMNQAFKNKTIAVGLGASTSGIGGVGGTTNIATYAKDYSPGFRASVAYTNANYYARGMVTYSTGLNKYGWALTASAIMRYSDQGISPGTFYNSYGYFLSLQKVFNDKHSISLTTFGAPTQRASNSATYQEAYDLAGSNLYNPNWGWQDGKRRSAKVVNTFDPTAIINWIWTPKAGTTLNTGFGFKSSNYASSALNWYNSADPRPDYYRYLPSYYADSPAQSELYTDLWRNNESFRQIDWQRLYQTNFLNNKEAEEKGTEKGATYILEDRHSNQLNFQFNSTLNHRLNDFMTLQGGIGANYTKGNYYKTIKDLLGAKYWRDVDTFSERDFPADKNMLQNDLNNPNRHVTVGDKFGYEYDINVIVANAWIQNMINLPKWDINYGVNLSYTTFQRDGKMKNGRAPNNSYGKGERHTFDNGGIKLGATYKLDGRNNFIINASYETKAPLADQAYVSPRIKDDAIADLKSERIISGDVSYVFNYRRFKGVITGFWTNMYNGIERYSFYDDQYSTFMNYVMTNVSRTYKGVEVGLAYKITPSITLSAAGTYSRYQYKNRPTGTRSYENGMKADTTQTVYLKNFYVGGTPQQAYNVGIDYAAPNNWFFNINASWMGDAYVDISPVRHEAMPNLWKICESQEQLEAVTSAITTQERLNDAFVLNLSIGKLIYLNRKTSMNLNLNIDNLLDNRKIMTGGYQQGRFDYTNFSTSKYPNKYYYAQGIKVFVNVGIRF
ncbi:MAG: TonB-dependent receptor [Muribaculaceae bacterium]|nr:TonB-dependent receptor [Muribaculaceae bacterium]